jgi:hypothetical protein
VAAIREATQPVGDEGPRASWEEVDILVWTPNMVSCVCFLVASYLAYTEVWHGAAR